MALLTTGTSVTLDETPELQNDFTTDDAGDFDDNDIAAAQLPQEFLDRLDALGADAPTMAALSGYTGAADNTGANAITFTPISNVVDVYFSDATGNPLDGVDSKLKTVDGDAIFLFTDTENNNILLGKTAGGEIVFSAYLQETSNGETGAKIWMVQYGALFNPTATNPDDPINLGDLVHVSVAQNREFSLEDAPSGQNLFMMFGDSEVALVVTGKSPANESEGVNISSGDTVNTSGAVGSTTIGVNNQMIVPGKGLYFTFVEGANSDFTVPNLTETAADFEKNILFTDLYGANSATFSVVQLQSGKAATLTITAFTTESEPGVNFVDGLGDLDDEQVDITSVVVWDKNNQDVTSVRTVTNDSGVITISGILAEDRIEYQTAANHNRVLIENTGTAGDSDAKVDIGGFRLTDAVSETVGVGTQMVFEDDGPSITLATPTDTLTLNTQDADTTGSAFDTDTKDFSGAFGIQSQNFGADGSGSSGVTWDYGLGVGSQGMDSELTSHGDAIYLYLVSGKVIGSTASTEAEIASENTVFDLTVSNTGTVTLTQYSAVDHDGPGSASGYSSQLETLGNGKVSLTGTATIGDRDLDTENDNKTLDLGGNISFNDDGPSITLATPTDTTKLNTQDADTKDSAYDTDSKDFSGAFGIQSQSFGADGSGSSGVTWDYALSVTTQGINSDLTSHSDAIYLYLVSGKVIGSTSATEGGIAAENTVFDLAVSSGTVTLTQYSAVDHDAPGSASGYSSQLETLGNGKISLKGTATIADYDLDTDADYKTLDLGGNISFNDDGPSITLATPTDTQTLNTQDADTAGSAYDTDTKDFSGAFGIQSQDFGADGSGASGVTWDYALGVTTQGINSDLTSHGDAIYLYLVSGKVVGSTASTEAEIASENTVFDLVVSGGTVTLTQYSAIDHATPGSSTDYSSQLRTLGDGKVTLTGTATIGDYDLDTDDDYKVLDLGGNISFNDDGPSITLATPVDTTTLNTHDALTIGTAYDTDSKSFAGAFGVASSSYGADGAGSETTTWAYELAITSQGINSGLATNSSTIRLFQLASGVVVGSTASDLASVTTENTVFDLAVNTAGTVTLYQYEQINHPLPGEASNYEDELVTLANGLVTLKGTATIHDFDSDTDADYKTLDLGGNILFSDHGPNAASISDLSGPNVADPISGNYDFSIGADLVNNDEATGIVLQSLSGATAFSSTTPGGRPITDTSVTWESENDTLVNYSYAFKYYAGPESTSLRDASGIVVFNKTDGTFKFDINAPLVGESDFSTEHPLKSFNYDTLGNKSPEIVVQKYADSFYGVLTGQASNPPSKTITLVSGSDHTYTPGETFSNSSTSYVNVATDTLGVNSDTIQAGELLNFDFYTSNPVAGNTSPPPRPDASVDATTARAYVHEVDITLSQLNADEDIVILLKLWDPETSTATTRLLLADNTLDFTTSGAYKVVKILEDDYDSAKYDIYGIQVLSSTEMIEGTAYHLTGGSAKTLTSSGIGYADTADLDVFKIIKIDVHTETVAHYDADLLFSGEVIDHDADYDGFSFKVHLEADGLPPYETLMQALVPPADPLMF